MYSVVQYDQNGIFVAVISGMGRNKGTLDHAHSRRTAQRHAARLRKERPNFIFKIENSY